MLTYFITSRSTGQDLAVSFVSAQLAADYIVEHGLQNTHDITAR